MENNTSAPETVPETDISADPEFSLDFINNSTNDANMFVYQTDLNDPGV